MIIEVTKKDIENGIQTNSLPTLENLQRPTRLVDLTGKVFSFLTVIKLYGRVGKRTLWWCRCVCGKEIHADSYQLKRGGYQSCGCKRNELIREGIKTHGGSYSSEYRIFIAARQRCVNPNGPRWLAYGGRGIEFRFDSFEQFLAEVGKRPSLKHSLDRIDVNGHYEPGNVRWATQLTQANNSRTNIYITIGEEIHTIAEWSRKLNISSFTIYQRHRDGYCDQCCLAPPPIQRCRCFRG